MLYLKHEMPVFPSVRKLMQTEDAHEGIDANGEYRTDMIGQRADEESPQWTRPNGQGGL